MSYPPSVEAGATYLASRRHPDDEAAERRYREELAGLHDWVREKDFAIVYNTGGFGGAALGGDGEWGSVVRGITAVLEQAGFSATVIEHHRSKNAVPEFLGEVAELARGYPKKAGLLAEKLDFLLHYHPSLKVIVTGRSHGAVFGNEALKGLPGRPRAYGIFAGTPFWYRDALDARALVVNYNGVQPDAFHAGDPCTILKANLHLPLSQPPPGGAIQVLKWYISMPGHEYSWEYPRVRSEIEAFLEKIAKARPD
ncbi:MAG: hypothetical protein HY673_16580 [Chloroflexi bacterium]|nr:hypothetical protein [Chloroflexota bacterium]